ncbi:hypothetical protein Tco_0353314 [Tanacetum coccineum]
MRISSSHRLFGLPGSLTLWVILPKNLHKSWTLSMAFFHYACCIRAWPVFCLLFCVVGFDCSGRSSISFFSFLPDVSMAWVVYPSTQFIKSLILEWSSTLIAFTLPHAAHWHVHEATSGSGGHNMGISTIIQSKSIREQLVDGLVLKHAIRSIPNSACFLLQAIAAATP